MSILNDSRERGRFLRFALVGSIGALVDFLFFNLFFTVLNLQAVISSVLSFVLALSTNFLLNRFWTFPDSRSKTLKSQMLQYGIVNVIGLLIRTPIFSWTSLSLGAWLLNKNFSLRIDPITLANNLALAIAIGFVLFWNYFANRYWTYNDIN